MGSVSLSDEFQSTLAFRMQREFAKGTTTCRLLVGNPEVRESLREQLMVKIRPDIERITRKSERSDDYA